MQSQSLALDSSQIITPEFLVAGTLTRDYLIDNLGRAHNDIPGGSALYAAVSVRLWKGSVGLIATIGEDYPHIWLEKITRAGISIQGVNVLPTEVDLRQFHAFINPTTVTSENPVAHYAENGLPFPKSLLGYHAAGTNPTNQMEILKPSLEPDIPARYLHATALHLCPLDYHTQIQLPIQLQKAAVNITTLEPPPEIMQPSAWEKITSLLKSSLAIICTDRQLTSLFQGRTTDLWQIAEDLGSRGCEIIIIRKGNFGYLILDAFSKKRYSIPAYPVKTINPANVNNAFAGGFLAGYKKTYDPVEAVLMGAISASHAMECTNALQMVDLLPGLPEARLAALRPMVQLL